MILKTLTSNSLLVTLVSIAVISLGSLALVHALLYTISLSDTVIINDKPSPRIATKDVPDITDEVSNRQAAQDNLGSIDVVSPHSSAADSLGLSESAQATSSLFHQVSVTSTLVISDVLGPGTSVTDALDLREKHSFSDAISDAISLLDSIARAFYIELIDALVISEESDLEKEEAADSQDETEEQDTERSRQKDSDRKVLDKSHFEKYPLDKMQVGGIYTLNSEGNVVQQVRAEDSIDISATIKNFQGTSQPYVFIVQIVDENDLAVQIILVSGTIENTDSADITTPWTPLVGGNFSLQIMIWDSLSSTPSALSASAVTIIAVSN